MSWIVETLLLDRNKLRLTSDPEDDDYNNLLLLEKKIDELIDKDVFLSIELDIIESLYIYGNVKVVYTRLGIDSDTFYKHFKNLCEKISFSLGGYFTNEGYVRYFVSKYKLNEENEELLKEFMKSRFRHRDITNFKSKKGINDK